MEATDEKIKITIDGNEIFVEPGMTILEAARENNIHIPTLCHYPALTSWGGCRICVVQVDGSPKLSASCVSPVRAGMVVETANEQVLTCRRTILEYLFAERNHNCMFCPQSGDCELQKLAYDLQVDHLSVPSSFDPFPTDVTSEYLAIDHNRCILCGRCVRACQEISGAHVLNFNNRGPHNLIGFDFSETREDSSCLSCGVCMQVCPTGAIYDRYRTHYAVTGHDTAWEKTASICPKCGLLCPTVYSVHDDMILKIEGNLQPDDARPDRGQLCYKGRFDVLKTPKKRPIRPLVRNREGELIEESWDCAVDRIADRLAAVIQSKGASTLMGLASTMHGNESLFLFRELMTQSLGAAVVDTIDGASFRNILKGCKSLDGPLKEASWKRVPEADHIVLVGTSPFETQPVISSLIRRTIFEKQTVVSVIGRRVGEVSFAAHHFPLKDADTLLLIGALRAEVMGSVRGNASAAQARQFLERLNLDAADMAGFYDLADALKAAENPLFITGEPLLTEDDGSGFENLIHLAGHKGLLPESVLRLIVLKPFGNSAGAWKLGLASRVEPVSNSGMTECILFLAGEEDLDPGILKRLEAVDFLTLIAPNIPEGVIGKADVVIPCRHWLEEDGSYTSLDGAEIAYKKKVLAPPAGLRPAWEVLAILAERVKVGPQFKTWDDLCGAIQEEIGG